MVLEVFRMLLTLLQFFASKFLVLALHLEAGSFPRPLSPQEEIRTFAALRAGDSSAREKLIRHNLRLVAHIAKKYYALPAHFGYVERRALFTGWAASRISGVPWAYRYPWWCQ